MKKLSTAILAEIVETKRKAAKMTQAQLAEKTGINRAQLSRLEQEDYYPSIPQLEALGEALDFDLDDVFINAASKKIESPSPLNIAVAGTGYVGLSIATISRVNRSLNYGNDGYDMVFSRMEDGSDKED